MRRIALLVLPLLLASSAVVLSQPAAAAPAEASRSIVRFTHEGRERAYIVYVPASVKASPGYPAPLLLMLHGKSQTSASAERYTGFNAVGERSKTIVVYPSASNGSWNAGTCCGEASKQNFNDVGYLDQVISQVKAANTVSPTRVYMAGFSNGGMMSYRYACERAANVTAIAVASGTLVTKSGCRPSRPVSVVHLHGMKDTVVPYNGTSYSSYLASPLRSIPSSAAGFANQNRCSSQTATTQPNAKVIRYDHRNCPKGGLVRVYRSSSLGHTWSRDTAAHGMDETTVAWSFLSAQVR